MEPPHFKIATTEHPRSEAETQCCVQNPTALLLYDPSFPQRPYSFARVAGAFPQDQPLACPALTKNESFRRQP